MSLYKLIFEVSESENPEEEAKDVVVGKRSRLAKDSLDDQIDSFLIKFEKTSSIEEDDLNESDLYNLEKLIFEQPEEALDPAADEAEEDIVAGSEAIEATESAEFEESQVDIDVFSGEVARLIQNYENLLNIEAVIFNRAKRYLKDEMLLDDGAVDRFEDILRTQHDITVVDFIRQGDKEEEGEAYGVGAYDAGTGGGAA